jgi:hypothetical protein
MTLGMLEYTVIGFEGNRFNGEIAKEISAVVQSGVIDIVDLVFVTKDINGDARSMELDNKDDPRFENFAPMLEGLTGLLTEEDIDKIAAGLAPNTSALIIMFEPEALEMLNAELDAAQLSA